jgi:hypothetical protein
MTEAQHQHRMITLAILACNAKLRSRKRYDIAARPETNARLAELRAERDALVDALIASQSTVA